jgi:hypothetical protein
MQNNKKTCCGCFGSLFKPRPKEKRQISEAVAQTETSGLSRSKVQQENVDKAKSDSQFFPRLQQFELPGFQGFKTTIITGHGLSNSICNDSREMSLRTPIVHNYLNDENNSENPVPLVFENLKKRASSRGLPVLAPVTPARGFRVRSQIVKNVKTAAN